MKNHSAALNATLNPGILPVLKEHKNQHKKEKLFSCTQSASKLGNPTDLKIHKNLQQNETPLSCIQCA